MRYSDIPKLTNCGDYAIDAGIENLVEHINEWEEELGLQLCPDFQRGHVWNEHQQIAYIEYLIRGGESGRDVYFNHPGWMSNFNGEFVCVDGLQRITAIKRFIGCEIPAFGAYYDQYEDKRAMRRNITIRIHVNDLKTRAEVLRWYVEMNEGGTPHTEKELDRVRRMAAEAEKEDSK